MILDEIAFPEAKRVKRAEIPWNHHLEGILLANVLKRKAHIKTDLNKELKWMAIFNDCSKNESFTELVPLLTTAALVKKFCRLRDMVSNKYSLEKEGSNLSALSEEIPPNDKLLINIITEQNA
jgi:hypothetical protein